ncbi:MAG: hypothetical protein F6K23_02215 [Okeania sp. SIO2C9]|nr:hypothetical protein [Okeania sp. SIO2C9]
MTRANLKHANLQDAKFQAAQMVISCPVE